jgi:hypothetical protein
LIIVIPMAGRSQRFRDAGYQQPKFMLPLQGVTMFDHAVGSFRHYFDTATFLFITRDKEGFDFALDHAHNLGIKNAQAAIDQNPMGLASTVFAGFTAQAHLRLNQPMLIHVVDTFREGFRLPENIGGRGFYEFCLQSDKTSVDGLLCLPEEPSQGKSYVFPFGLSLARLRSTGICYVPSAEKLMTAYQKVVKNRNRKLSLQQAFLRFGIPEEFVEGLSLISALRSLDQKMEFRIINREDVTFSGVPAEYDALCRHWPKREAELSVPLSRTLAP